MTTQSALALALLIAAPAIACEDVPSLTYAEAGVEMDVESKGADAVGAAADAAGDVGCPGPNPPPGASVCCGSVPCSGNCSNRCSECEGACTAPGTFCCAKTNNVICRPIGAVCN